MRAIVLALGLMAAPAMAAEQFDLVCKARKDAEHYRIDLAAGEWCFAECKVVQKISSVTSGMIILAEHEPARGDPSRSYNQINRVTGEWRWYNYDPRYSSTMDIRGTCEPAPFSGIAPAGGTKF